MSQRELNILKLAFRQLGLAQDLPISFKDFPDARWRRRDGRTIESIILIASATVFGGNVKLTAPPHGTILKLQTYELRAK
jgi:hypothetical protein